MPRTWVMQCRYVVSDLKIRTLFPRSDFFDQFTYVDYQYRAAYCSACSKVSGFFHAAETLFSDAIALRSPLPSPAFRYEFDGVVNEVLCLWKWSTSMILLHCWEALQHPRARQCLKENRIHGEFGKLTCTNDHIYYHKWEKMKLNRTSRKGPPIRSTEPLLLHQLVASGSAEGHTPFLEKYHFSKV